MKHGIPVIAAIALFAALIGYVDHRAYAAPVKNTLEVSGWLPYWKAASSTADTLPNVGALTTVHPFGYTVSKDGIVYDTPTLTEDPWKSLITEARAKKVRVIPTVMWGDGAAIHRILSNTESRIKLEDDITALAYENGWDGIDIDFEAKWAETRPYFSTFLKGLYQRMGKKWVYCTIESRTPLDSRYDTIPANIEYANDFVQINKYCDRVQIMAYDQGSIDIKLNRTANGPYAPVADIRWVEKVMREAMKVIPARKLVLGIPTYGYEYSVTPLPEYGYRYDRMWAFNPKYAYETAAKLAQTPVRTAGGELQVLYLPQMLHNGVTTGDITTSATSAQNLGVPTNALSNVATAPALRPAFNVMTWNDSVSVAQKIALAKKLGVRGVAVFKFDGGEDQKIWDVLWGR